MADGLLREIVRCPNVAKCLKEPNTFNPCRTIVEIQHSNNLDSHQVPEPWSGQLDRAPILFLSSNPSIKEKPLDDHGKKAEEYPTGSWADADIEDFFTNRFGGGKKNWITGGIRFLQMDGFYSEKHVRFWAAVHQRAIELLQRDVAPGIDYALSEVVHCKSREEEGVREAVQECARRYLARVLSFSAAKIIVVLGDVSKFLFADLVGVNPAIPVHGPVKIANKRRFVAFLPHPNARTPRTLAILPSTDLARIRNALK